MASTTDKLNRIYADEMCNHPYGYAIYQPAFTSVIKPGMVGYFDPDGIWSPLVDLTDTGALTAAGLKPPNKLMSAPPQEEIWGPMTSKSVSGHNLDSDIAPSITGLPLSASLKVKYTSSSSFGALLVTSPPITHSSYYYSSPFSSWVKDNMHALLNGEHKDDIHANGLVVVTQTYSTSKATITAWTDGKNEVFLGFDGALPGVGKTDDSGGWSKGNSASGWQEYDASGNDNVVVFVGGLWYDCKKEGIGSLFSFNRTAETGITDAAPAQEPVTEGNEKTFAVTNHEGDKYHVEYKVVGKPLPYDK